MTAAAAQGARPAVGLRAMYRRVVAPEICDALERSTGQLAQPGRPGAAGSPAPPPRPRGTDPGSHPDNLDSERTE